jgi:protein gp37
MTSAIPRRSVEELPKGWYPYSARPVLPELEGRVLADLGETWRTRLPDPLTAEASRDPFALRTWPEQLDEVVRWKEPRIVLLGGGADPFESRVDPSYIRDIFAVMISAPEHVFVVLTGRVDRAASFLRNLHVRNTSDILPGNIIVGTPAGPTPAELARVELLRLLPIRSRFAVTTSAVRIEGAQGSQLSS